MQAKAPGATIPKDLNTAVQDHRKINQSILIEIPGTNRPYITPGIIGVSSGKNACPR